MKPDLLDRLACPWCCATGLALHVGRERDGEVESGEISCRCGARFPIDRFVPSFFSEARMTDAERRMLADGRYWSGFYNYYDDLGYRYFIDSRLEVAPLLFHGILRAVRLGRWGGYAHWHEPHYRDFFSDGALGPVGRGCRALELGCGAGWLTLELARRGAAAVGQDTALEALVRAKRYAMAEGVDAEYLHASSLNLPLAPGAFNLFAGFQALHHFEDLPQVLARVHEALAPDGRVVIFEHRRLRPPKLGKLANALDRLCLPVIRRFYPPTARRDWVASPNEDKAIAEMDQALRAAFRIGREKDYSLLLQALPVYAYFLTGERLVAFVAGSMLSNAFDRLVATLLPDRCEHRLYVGTRRA
ncbi:MAG: class I SAM-dependent methyltransferase [Acidobacteria bacterium]|nr:class I SAM-dependent methyltransferase [Acidobacteriota bacterium]